MNKTLLCFASSLLFLAACKHKPSPQPASDYGNFPEPVGKIFATKCATAGCHNETSQEADLRLDNWEHLFSGTAVNGAPVVAFSPDYSPLLYFINPDSGLGPVAEPRMPNDNPPLSREEYLTIKDWIANGAPDRHGNIPFAANADTRQKIYITMGGCDLIGVVDAEKKTIMRYIKVGKDDSGAPENPHNVKFTDDGKFAYVCFSNGDYLQKIDATTDKVVASVPINYGNSGNSSFNILTISPDGSVVLVTDLNKGRVIVVNMNTMTVIDETPQLNNAHGIAANATFDTFFVTGQAGNTIYRMSLGNTQVKRISLVDDGKDPISFAYNGSPNPHDLIMTPDYSRYFVTCQGTGDVRVMDAHTNKLLKVIGPLGAMPQELAISPKTKTIFVTFMEDVSEVGEKFRGSVWAINYETYAARKISAKFSQPHGLSVDERNNILYVASTNTFGPRAHHVSQCGGNNGYYQMFDLNTLLPYKGKDRRYEVSVQPYSVATRFR